MPPADAPAKPATIDGRCCGNCLHFYRRQETEDTVRLLPQEEAEQIAAQYGHHLRRGHCRRYPTEIVKDGADWCGEFQPTGS